MAELKVQCVKYEMAYNNIKQLYELAGRLMKSPTNVLVSDKQQFLARYRDIERYRQQMEDAIAVIFSNTEQMSDEKHLQIEKDFAAFNEMFYSVQVLHSTLIESDTNSGGSSQLKPNTSTSSEFHLPKICLPRFSGSYTEWPNFVAMFNSLIHENHQLSNVEKMHYLFSVLDKEPLALIKNLKLTDANYSVAYKLLTERFENKRLIANTHVEAILSIANMSQVNVRVLSKTVNTIKENLSALVNLDFPVKSWSFLLLHIVLKKMPIDLRAKFEAQIDPISIPKFDQLLEFLETQMRILENVSSSSSYKSSSSNALYITNSDCNQSKVKYGNSCSCCNMEHSIYYCAKFNSMTPEERQIFVENQKLCSNCLRKHHVSKCSSNSVCQVCQKRHHTKLHVPYLQPTSIPATPQNEAAEITINSAFEPHSLHGVGTNGSSFTMILGTALVQIQDVEGNFHTARALIDCGSQVSIIAEDLARKLKLPRSKSGAVSGLGANSSLQTRGTIRGHIRSLADSSQSISTYLLIMKHITHNLPSSPLDQKILEHCKNLVLADATFTRPGQIELLLGIEVYDQILDGRRFNLGKNLPTAYSSIFGWVLMGKAPAASPHSHSVASMACMVDLNQALTRFWEIEEPPRQPILDPEDILCEKHFVETHKRDDSGRFIVSLPFKVNHKPLGDTQSVALKRFYNLERRLQRDDRLHKLYTEFMEDYFTAGHMRKVSDPNTSQRYYIPHHGILREHSSTTKLRVVFDASTPSSTGISLNQTLMSGPKLQKNVEDIILRFRSHKYVFTCDIKQMYRQVRLDDSDCKYQTIYWRDSPEKPLKQYELTTVTYGISSSAFQAIRAVHELAHLNLFSHPEGARVLLEDTFVDDVVSGADTLDALRDVKDSLITILSQGGFLLRKWSSNSEEFLRGISAEHCEQPYRFEADGDSIFKVLGLEWNAACDSFVYRVSKLNRNMTMRGVLSNIARLYDPCGFLAPITFYAKHIMQLLWSRKCGWDDPLPLDINKNWLLFMSEFNVLDTINLPRWIAVDQPANCQIHGFSDASERGFAACVYLRVQGSNEEVSISLLLAKSRVAPLRQKITVPKLELSAALLLARLLEHIKGVLREKIKITSITAWCDSNIVLSWLKTSPHALQTYEGNRVSQIQALAPDTHWRHISSEMNAADSASRGQLPSQLVSNSLWWSPMWLKDNESTWPGEIPTLSDAELPGLKSGVSAASYIVEGDCDPTILNRYSSFSKLQSVLAWCLRFAHNARNPQLRRAGSLSVAELSLSLRAIIRMTQTSEFSQTIQLLRDNKPIKNSLARLNPFLDSEGLLRVGGRLGKSDLSYDTKYPLLLPKSHSVTDCIVDHYHRMFHHPSANTLINLLRRKFWILSTRQVVRRRIFRCLRCYRLRPKSVEPFMAELPVHRVTSCRPFQKVGLDFAGPFQQKNSRLRNARSTKSYLCIFICFATKCAHLELVSELSSNAFLACLDRFVSRRGLPSDIFSDRGTNFVGASNYLKEIFQFLKNSKDELIRASSQKQIVWHFNPPASPHMGGLWESAVKSAKQIIFRIIGDRPLLFEELATVFSKVEAALNSRPLCPLSSDPNDLEALTPGHFLIGQPLLALPEVTHEQHVPILKRWQLLRQITQHFWKRWQTEYLHCLQQRPKWVTQNVSFKEGDLVIIRDQNLPPLQWKLARVTKAHPGSDGIVRVVELRTSTGNLIRPVVKLCPLLPADQ